MPAPPIVLRISENNLIGNINAMPATKANAHAFYEWLVRACKWMKRQRFILEH